MFSLAPSTSSVAETTLKPVNMFWWWRGRGGEGRGGEGREMRGGGEKGMEGREEVEGRGEVN